MDVSIITPVFNGAETLSRCIDSVLMQQGVQVEHLVEDGGSKDNTLTILESYDEPKLRWQSAPDKGVYDGMNRGIKRAQGKWLLFLGCNDRLANPDALQQCLAQAKDEADILLGQAEYDSGARWYSTLDKTLISRNKVHHQGTLYRRHLFDGKLFDDTLKVYGDYDHNLYLLNKNIRQQTVDVLVSYCANAGLSDTPKLKHYLEQRNVRHRYYNSLQCLPYDMLMFMRYAAKRLKTVF